NRLAHGPAIEHIRTGSGRDVFDIVNAPSFDRDHELQEVKDLPFRYWRLEIDLDRVGVGRLPVLDNCHGGIDVLAAGWIGRLDERCRNVGRRKGIATCAELHVVTKLYGNGGAVVSDGPFR